MNTIHAIYENGSFRPVGNVDLPDPCEVEFEPRIVQQDSESQKIDDIYAVLAERYHTGEHDIAERHNEHQP
jgi:predicted DNA-binding antitoxin AbrB/MazE fold protein